MKKTKQTLALLLGLIVWSLNINAQTKPNCARVIDPVATCDNGVYTLSFSVQNLATWPIHGLTVRPFDPNITGSSTMHNGPFPFFNIPDIAVGSTSGIITIPLYVATYAPSTCFDLTFCNYDTFPYPIGMTPQCCTVDSVCFQLPMCQDTGGHGGPCDKSIDVTSKPSDSTGNCCFNISFINNYIPANIGTISFSALGGVHFSLTTTSAGWADVIMPSSTYREITSAPVGVGMGTYPDFIKLCITSSASAPHKILVNYKDVNGVYACEDTLIFDQCKLVNSKCATIVNDSLYCMNNKTYFKFNLQNNSADTIKEVAYNIINPTKFVITPNVNTFPGASAILPGATSAELLVEIDTMNGGDGQFCIELSTFDDIHSATTAPRTCCTDSVIMCLPFINCKLNGCCEFDAMKIPNGITPNGDKKNDTWVLVKPSSCDSIKIEVFNRWGNKVYQDDNYLNNWGGTNQGGTLLPQGTYFVIIELKNGSKKGLYVDVRY
jgi:gliding motility-associated-like protein